MRRRARAAPYAGLLLIGLMLASCEASSLAASSVPTPATSALPSATAQPSPRSGPAVARFSLALTAEPVGIMAFDLYLRTESDSTARVTTLCGMSPAPPCSVADSPFSSVIRDLRAGGALAYRIERVLPDASIAVVTQGTLVLQRGMSQVRASYP
jgi:hypothetical protein